MSRHGPTGTFTHNAWHSPEVLEIVSKIAGIDLVPVMDYDIGHINFSVKSEEETRKELDTINQQKKFFDDDEGIAGCPWEDDSPVVGWHTDSYPFVCVLMMSDCTNMVGGETALKKADGSVLKVRGPEMVGRSNICGSHGSLYLFRVVLSFSRVATSPIRRCALSEHRSVSPLLHLFALRTR